MAWYGQSSFVLCIVECIGRENGRRKAIGGEGCSGKHTFVLAPNESTCGFPGKYVSDDTQDRTGKDVEEDLDMNADLCTLNALEGRFPNETFKGRFAQISSVK